MPYHDSSPTFFYRRWRTSDAPAAVLLLLHGFAENSAYYHRLAAELTRVGIEVWSPDHIGHGLSGDHDGLFETIEQLAANGDTLFADIEKAHPSLPLFILGHSLGGLTAVELASRVSAKLSGLVLSGPPVVGRPEVLPDPMVFSLDPSYIDEARNDVLALTSPDAEANLWRAVADYIPRLEELTERLDVPTLVIFGEHDVFTTPKQAEKWAQALPQGRLWMVDGGYHDILQDKMHREVAAEIADFIRGNAAGASIPEANASAA